MLKVLFSGTLWLVCLLFFSCNRNKWSQTEEDGIVYVTNDGGQNLAYSSKSGIKLLFDKGFAFKDLNRNNILDSYEDWRLTVEERAKNLASLMSIEQISGLMLYSTHQAVPAGSGGPFAATYDGKSFKESGAEPWALTDQQVKFLTDDNLRHVLITRVQNPVVAARWNNRIQAMAESIGLGIPVNISSDPRHGTVASAEYNLGAGGQISMWPGSLGKAATFNPELVQQFGRIASREYRALGITTALSPQVDLATEPRWSRVSGTFGEDPKLAADMSRAYVDGFQTSEGDAEIQNGWGYHSVNAMVKHWPGGGTGEGGRDAHFGYGAYAVFPGNNLTDHLKPFTEGAFKLTGKTKMASAVMPYYAISYNQDKTYNENVGNGYSKYLITDLLRDQYGFTGVVCTDWMITADVQSVDAFKGKPWGVEKLTVVQRHYKALMAGIDQFGGNNQAGAVIEAYRMGVNEYGEAVMRQRFEQSAVRLLQNIFRVGLFENPYLDVDETEKIVGNPEFMKLGYEAQLKSVVMLKNKGNVLPLRKKSVVFIPRRYLAPGRDWFGNVTQEKWEYPVNMEIAGKYFEITENPDEAELGLVFIESPRGMTGFDREDLKKGGNGYMPVSLQYGEYIARETRDTSIAGGSPFEDFRNRSYKWKKIIASNATDAKLVNDTHNRIPGLPLVLVVNIANPMIFSEIEPLSDAIIIHFGVQDQAIFDLLTGRAEPSGLLPLQMPANMTTVELQYEDVPRDMNCYTDSEGNIYDFGFGLGWNGRISDARTEKYVKK